MDEFKTLDLVKVVNQNRYGIVDSVNSINNKVCVIFAGWGGKEYKKYNADELVRIGECNCFDNTLVVGDIVRIKAVESQIYNAIARVSKVEYNFANVPYFVLEIFNDGYSTQLTKEFSYRLDMLEIYSLSEDIIYEDNTLSKIELDDLVTIKETDNYGFVDLIKDNTYRVNYFDETVGRISSRFYKDQLTLRGKPKKNVNDISVGDVVKISKKGDPYNKFFAKVNKITDNFVNVDIYNDKLRKNNIGHNWIVGKEYVFPYHLVGDLPLNDIQEEQQKQENKEVDNNKLKQSTDTSAHYAHQIQPIEYIQSIMKDLPVTGFEGACIKDIIKYCSRFGLKDDKEKEAKKILDYALWLFMATQKLKINPRLDNHESIKKLVIDSHS